MSKRSKYDNKFPIGHQFNNWTVIESTIQGKPAKIQVRCICGTEKLMDVYNMISERSTSCGCQLKHRTKDKNPNWKGQGNLSATTLSYNNKHTGFSNTALVQLAEKQNYSCIVMGESLTGSSGVVTSGSYGVTNSMPYVVPIDNSQPFELSNACWVGAAAAPMVRHMGDVKTTIAMANSMVNTTTHNNIFEKLGFKSTTGDQS